nr:glycoside hydrolase domain-containing protein [Streptococcus equi]
MPLTGVPFGMHYLSVETSQDRGAWWFHPDDHSFSGIRLTHQPSPWVGDFATVTFLPVSGPLTKGDVFHNQTSYRPKEAAFRPHLLEIFSQRHRILTRATAAAYSFHCDFSFDNGKAGLIIHNPGKSSWQVTADGKTILGCVQNITDCQDKDLAMFVYLQFSSPVLKKLIGEDLNSKSLDDCSKTSFTYLQFADDLKHLELRAAASFISFDQAQLNWQRDFPRSFEKSLEYSRKEWLSYLSRIDIKDKDFDKVKAYYQHFYRALLFPKDGMKSLQPGRRFTIIQQVKDLLLENTIPTMAFGILINLSILCCL